MSKFKKRFKIFVFLVLLVAIIVCVIKINSSLSDYNFGYTSENAVAGLDAVEDKTSFNALLLGTDVSGLRTDAIMLVNINKEEKTIRMLSIPRDTRVRVDGKKCKINSCYAKGVDVLIDEVKELTGAPINYYAVIKPGTLAKIVDCLGGVEYEVERDMHYSDPYQDLYIDLEKGKQILDGDKAEQYCRFRSYAMGDLERTNSQQKFFKALFEQKFKLKYVTKLKSVYDITSKNLESNITFKDIADNISIMQMLSDGGQIESVKVPGGYNDMKKDGVSYYLIEDEDLTDLHKLCSQYFDGNSKK